MALAKLTETEKAYLAGFIDADGCVTISRRKGRNALNSQINFTNTNLPVMKWIKLKLNLSESCITKYKAVPEKNHKIRYAITLGKKEVVTNILKEIKQYMIIKKEQANLVIEFLEINTCKQGIKNYQLSDREIEIYNRIKILNKVGVF